MRQGKIWKAKMGKKITSKWLALFSYNFLSRMGASRTAGATLWAGGRTHALYKRGGRFEYGFQFKGAAIRARDLHFGFFLHAGTDVMLGVALGTAQVIIWHFIHLGKVIVIQCPYYMQNRDNYQPLIFYAIEPHI